jgi:hypothetical protein
LWNIGRQDEAVVACREAVDIARRVAQNEVYFLPSLCEALELLSAYLGGIDDGQGKSAAGSELAVRREMGSLSNSPQMAEAPLVHGNADDWTQSVEIPRARLNFKELGILLLILGVVFALYRECL